MSRNGAGTYTLPAGNPVVTGTTISSTWANNSLSDIATALTQSLAKDGQTVPTANIPLGGFKITGLGAPTTAGDALAFGSPMGAISGTTGTFSGAVSGTTGTFSGAVSGAAISGTTGTFTGNVSGVNGTFTGPVSGTTGTFTGNVQMASANGGQLAGLRNKIINGNMGIFQRGTTAVTTAAAYGPADRWTTTAQGDTFSATQGSFVSGDTLYDTGGAQYFTQVVVTSLAADPNYCLWTQKVEDVRILAGKTVTVSFWAKAASGTPSIGLEITQNFGTGGSTTVTGTGQAQALTTTWAQYTKTFAVPSINGKTVGTENTHFTGLNFWLDAGSDYNTRAGTIGQASKTVSIAQVQLEIGTTATPFEQRPIGMELALCQRYLPAFNSSSTVDMLPGAVFINSTTASTVISLPVTPRVPPTGITISAVSHFQVSTTPGGGVATAVSFANGSLNSIRISVTSSAMTSGNSGQIYFNTASGYLLCTGCEL
jgi:hypothetical protein